MSVPASASALPRRGMVGHVPSSGPQSSCDRTTGDTHASAPAPAPVSSECCQAEPSCSPASLYQPSHVRLAPLRLEGQESREPTSCGPGAPSGPGGGDPGGDGAWSLPPDELFTIFSKIYDEVVCWRRNLCMLPFGAEGSSFVRELTRLISLFSDGLPGRRYAWYAVVAACHLLLQKPLGADSSKETRRHLAGRMERWRTGDFDGLLRECRCLQAHLPTRSSSRQSDGIDDIVFAGMVSHGKVGTATRYVESNASGRVLDLSEEVAPGRRVLDVLKEKHPAPVDAQPDILLPGGPDPPEPVLYDKITPAMIRRLASRLSGAARPSALDSAAWRRMMTSYDGASDSLCGVLSRAAKCICTETLDETCLRPFLAARLIPLDKQPGVRPIAIGEVFRRVICKAIMSAIERDVLLAVTPYQLCVGIPSACEVAVGILGQEFQSESCDGILLVDASNAFNAMNRSAALHNIPRICPAAGRAFVNLYQSDIPLFLEGGLTVLSREGTCQGDPLAMAFYALAMSPLAQRLSLASPDCRQLWFADDDAAAAKLASLREYWRCISSVGPRYGYFPNAQKSILLVKPELEQTAKEVFHGTGIAIRSDGVRYLGGYIGSNEFVAGRVSSQINTWLTLMNRLTVLAKTQPQAAYHVVSTAVQAKWRFLQRVCEVPADAFGRLDNVIVRFCEGIFGRDELPESLRKLLSLPVRLGGLGIPVPSEGAARQLELSRASTGPIVEFLAAAGADNAASEVAQSLSPGTGLCAGDASGLARRRPRVVDAIAASRAVAGRTRAQFRESLVDVVSELGPSLTPPQRLLLDTSKEKGVSTWVTSPPSQEHGTILSKSDFRDGLALRYGLALHDLPTSCICRGSPDFTVDHAMTCPAGGYPTARHNEIRDLLSELLSVVVPDVEREPVLLSLDGEDVSGSHADQARVDIRVLGFWTRQQSAFFDVRVTHPKASLRSCAEVKSQLAHNERAKRRQYGERITQVDRGSFTPLVFGTNGQAAVECEVFLKTLASRVAEKCRDISYAVAISTIRAKIGMCLLRWQITCLRGSRTSYRRRAAALLAEMRAAARF